MNNIFGTKEISDATQRIVQKDKSTWVPLYYSIREHRVYMEGGNGRYFLTTFLNPATPEEVEETVHYMMEQ